MIEMLKVQMVIMLIKFCGEVNNYIIVIYIMIWEIFNDIFWISLATLTFAFLGTVLKACLKSKCSDTNICFGLVTIHRKVELEDIEKTDAKL